MCYNIKHIYDYPLLSTCFLTKVVEQVKPVKVYNQFKNDRIHLLKEQKTKSGVYILVNLVNGHNYVGSSANIAGRMRNYLNNSFLKNQKNSNMPIVKALLKYGQDNFAVLIVEYTDIKILTVRETYYISKFLPYYNVLNTGYSSLGYKHTEATKQMLSDLAKNRVHSEETKTLISRALVGKNNPFYNKTHSTKSKLRMSEANSAHLVYVYNSYKILQVIFPSVLTLAKLINSNHSTILGFINSGELFRGDWYFSKLPYNISDIPLIFDFSSIEFDNLISDVKNNSHIKKAVFLYNLKREFIQKFDGVTQAKRELNISHEIIKKHALRNKPYQNYIFSYERLIT